MNSQTDSEKIFFIHTLGCKVNQYESQAMREILLKSGFKECLSKDMADIYIVNTCTVTNEADKGSRHMIGLLHRTNPKARIVVTGCYVERNAENISGLPGVSHIVKNQDKARIAEVLKPAVKDEKIKSRDQEKILKVTGFKGHEKAFVKIQDGCSNFCSYCKVPLVRNVLISKPVKDITDEVSELVENGFQEIVLTGICLGAWGKDTFYSTMAKGFGLGSVSLVDALRPLCKIEGNFRIRLSSIEPKYVTDELIDFMAANRKICAHLHIPLQSGDDDILKSMNRPYTSGEYSALIDRIRSKIKDIAITTDVLIGFPGESDSNFRNTVNLIKSVKPLRTHIFTFSRREGTAAYKMESSITDDVLKKRFCELNVAALSASYIYRMKFLDRRLDVLVEGKRERQTGLLTGYSDNYIKVVFEGDDSLMKKIISVKVKEINLVYTTGVYGND